MINFHQDINNRFNKIHVLTKLVWLVCFSVMILAFRQGVSQGIILVTLVLIVLLGRINPGDVARFVLKFTPLIVILFLLHLFYHDGRELLSIWILTATDIGLKAAAFNVLRLLNFMLSAYIFIVSTNPIDCAAGATSVLKFIKAKIVQELSLVLFIALRFFPHIANERKLVATALKARGLDFDKSYSSKLKMQAKMLMPVFARVIKQVDDVTTAVTLKSFKGRYFTPSGTKISGEDIALGLVMIAATVGLIAV